MFIEFLKSLSISGEKAPPERVQELSEIIESQADLDAEFDIEGGDHIARLISCLFMAIPFFERGASSSKFLNYLNKHIFPVFDKLPVERKVDMLKNLAESSPFTSPQDSRQILPYVVLLLKNSIPRRKAGEEMSFTYVECLLYAFHHLANKAPNATNSLCGFKIVTDQLSDKLGEDFSEQYKDFTERLSSVEDLTRGTIKKLTQGMTEHNKALAAAVSDEAKKAKRQNTTAGLRTYNNILAMAQPLHAKTPTFIGDKKITLSWKEQTKPSVPSTASLLLLLGERGPQNGNSSKKGCGGSHDSTQNQGNSRAVERLSYVGGRSGGSQGGMAGPEEGSGRWFFSSSIAVRAASMCVHFVLDQFLTWSCRW